MDWSRAKTILIVAFLLLNLLLVWESVEKSSSMVVDEVDPIYTVQLADLLRQQQVRLEAEIPTEVPRAALLTAQFQAPSPPEDGIQGQPVAERTNLWRVPFPSPIFLSPEEVENRDAERFADRIAHFAEYRADPLLSTEQVWRYTQQWEGAPLFNSRLEIQLERGGVASYLQTYAEVAASGEEQNLISAVSAVNSLLENSHIPAGATLLDVRFGYYGRLHNSEEQVLSPVWRVVYRSKAEAEDPQAPTEAEGPQWVYVNAITGSVDTGGSEAADERDE